MIENAMWPILVDSPFYKKSHMNEKSYDFFFNRYLY